MTIRAFLSGHRVLSITSTSYPRLAPRFLAARRVTTMGSWQLSVENTTSGEKRVTVATSAAPRHAFQKHINLECPARVTAIEAALHSAHVPFHSVANQPLHPATLDAVAAIHTRAYLDSLGEQCARIPDDGSAEVIADPEEPTEYTYVTRHSYNDALSAVVCM